MTASDTTGDKPESGPNPGQIQQGATNPATGKWHIVQRDAVEDGYKWLLFWTGNGELEADVMLPSYMADRIIAAVAAAEEAGL